MALVCRSLRLLFIMAPRTGCSAVAKLLRDRFGGEWLPESHVRNPGGAVVVQRKHCTLDQLKRFGLLSQEEADGMLKVVSVRDPFDSLVSLYTKRRNTSDEFLHERPNFWINRTPRAMREVRYCRTHEFDEWVRRQYRLRAMLAALRIRQRGMYDRFTDGADVIMRFQCLEDDLNDVLSRVGVKQTVSLPRFNPTSGRPDDYREHYSPSSRRIVERAFRADLERYGYSF